MKRNLLLLLLILLGHSLCYSTNSKELKSNEPNNKKINFGLKAGFNSSMFLVSRFKIKDVSIKDYQNNYKIGYFGAMFMRFNIQRHFLQPEISYNISRCEIEFDKLGSQHPDIAPDYASINSTIHSIDIPLLYGFNITKNGPYGMSIFLGPKLKCIWTRKNKITFDNFDQKGIYEELKPFNFSAVIGVAVNISRIFFDFRYEQGLHNISRSVLYDNINTDGSIGVSNLTLNRREQVLSFSLGVLF